MLSKDNKEILYKYYNEKGEHFNDTADTPFYRLNSMLEAIRNQEKELCECQIAGAYRDMDNA